MDKGSVVFLAVYFAGVTVSAVLLKVCGPGSIIGPYWRPFRVHTVSWTFAVFFSLILWWYLLAVLVMFASFYFLASSATFVLALPGRLLRRKQ